MDQQRLPAVIRVALAVHAGLLVLKGLTVGAPAGWMYDESWYLAMAGVAVATSACLALGSFELAERVPADRARWLRVAGVLQLATGALDLVAGAYEHALNEAGGWTAMRWAFCVLIVGAATCLALAAWTTRGRLIALVLVPLALVIVPPPPLDERLASVMAGPLYLLVRVAHLGALITTLVLIARTSLAAPADRSSQALSYLLGSVRIRLAAIGILVAATLFATSAGSPAAWRFLIVAPVLVNLVAAIGFAVGAALFARGARRGIDVAFAVAAWLSAWLTGVLANQAPFQYGVTTENHRHDRRYRETAAALDVPLRVVVIAVIAIALAALAVHAHQRGSVPLARFIRIRATAFVVLMTLAMLVATQTFTASSASASLAAAVVTAGFGIVGLVLAARALERAATATEGSELPTATLVSSD